MHIVILWYLCRHIFWIFFRQKESFILFFCLRHAAEVRAACLDSDCRRTISFLPKGSNWLFEVGVQNKDAVIFVLAQCLNQNMIPCNSTCTYHPKIHLIQPCQAICSAQRNTTILLWMRDRIRRQKAGPDEVVWKSNYAGIFMQAGVLQEARNRFTCFY